MPDDTPLSETAQQVMLAMYQQLGEEITRGDLRERTRLTDSALLGALNELQSRRWVEHTGYPGSPSGDAWRITSLGQSAGPQGIANPALSKSQEGTVVLRPPRSRGLIWGFLIAGVLYVLLLGGLLVPGGGWVGIFLILFVGVWIGLLLNLLTHWTEVAQLTSTTLITRTWYGKTHKTPRASIAQTALVRVHFGGSGRGSGTSTYLLFLDTQGHCLNWLLTNDIPKDAEKAFAQQLRVPLRDLRREEMRRRQLKEAFPGTTAGQSVGLALVTLAAALLGLGITILLLMVASGVIPL